MSMYTCTVVCTDLTWHRSRTGEHLAERRRTRLSHRMGPEVEESELDMSYSANRNNLPLENLLEFAAGLQRAKP